MEKVELTYRQLQVILEIAEMDPSDGREVLSLLWENRQFCCRELGEWGDKETGSKASLLRELARTL